jgi:hypothetical protein
MIRRFDNRPATREQLRRLVQVREHVGEQLPRVRERKPRVPQTAVVLCVVCRKAYPLHSHDTLVCARARGLDGNDLYVREHALVSLCGGRCGAVVSSPGAVCIGCIGSHHA